MNDYKSFLEAKTRAHVATGIDIHGDINSHLFDWQAEVVRWALRKGRACLFEDTGLGKTRQQLAWASHIPGNVLIMTPLAVADQTLKEAARVGIPATISRDGSLHGQITITNYERLHRFDLSQLAGIVLDEASIIKSHDGATRNAIINGTAHIPFRLACTATPAPNDHMELGNQAEFVGAMSRVEMLATFFCHDGGDTSEWRLKGHAKAEFWRWVASWAMMIRTPADIGYECSGYNLPPLNIVEHVIKSGIKTEGMLFTMPVDGLNEQRAARKQTMNARVQTVADLVNKSDDSWVVWCELNAEGDDLEDAIVDSVQVAGADDDDVKTERLNRFSSGEIRKLVTKPKIASYGMNWQHSHNMAFVGLSHSWEQFYQAVRRQYRFGQTMPVNVHIVTSDVERNVLENIKAKQKQADVMAAEMVAYMEETMKTELKSTRRIVDEYQRETVSGYGWTLHRGDCVDVVRDISDDSIDYTIYSPPFSSLYTYSASDRDMGNCRNDSEFFDHYAYLVRELFRVTRPGRLLSFHCMDMPTTKERDGFIGLRDFRGDLIRAHQAAGWVLHSQVTIWKDPVTAMQRTKALGLLHKTIRSDSSRSRQGIPDYLVTMMKPGVNTKPISHTHDEFPVEMWQRYASPVWVTVNGIDEEGFGICDGKTISGNPSSTINPSDTLQYRSARENEDERHICPLQLEVIRRAMNLWTAPNDLVLSPFTGIGSEGHIAITSGRRFVGAELKHSYYKQAAANLNAAASTLRLF